MPDSVRPTDNRPFEGEGTANPQDDLREQVSNVLISRADVITADTVAIFPYSGAEALDYEYCERLGRALIRLLAFAIRDASVDPRGVFVAELRGVVLERSLEIEQLFTFAYLTERTALDELALDESIGATTEPWPLVAQLVRRASFEFLASFVARARQDPTDAAITDKLTTLHTRPMFDAVLIKEAERAGRFGYALSLIVFDVDRLSAINEQHGYGVGNKILERLGILIRKYFRQHDWVARHGDDEIAVLMMGTDAGHAAELAERARVTVEERLGFTDHLTDRLVPVTVSAAVVNVHGTATSTIDPERLLMDAEAAMTRAKRAGRNRVEVADGTSASRTLPHNSPSA
jgi:diguanylate cyclase (GGDEF)-like protein